MKRKIRKLPTLRSVTPEQAINLPLTNLRPDQIMTVKLGADPDEDDHVEIDMMIPTEGGALVSYEEHILLEDEAPAYLRQAATAFFDACCRAVRERVIAKTRTCAECLGCCCYVFDRVDVSPGDVVRLREGGVDVGRLVELYEDDHGRPRTTLKGHVGMLRKAELVHPLSGETVSACPAFDGTGCTIYEHRPQACREFTMIGCEQFEQRPEDGALESGEGAAEDGEHESEPEVAPTETQTP